jgi:hypothetical protein
MDCIEDKVREVVDEDVPVSSLLKVEIKFCGIILKHDFVEFLLWFAQYFSKF